MNHTMANEAAMELLYRVKAATEGSWQLDQHIEARMRQYKGMTNWGVFADADDWLASGQNHQVPPYSTSIDTCQKLLAIVMPDAWLDLSMTKGAATAKVCFEGNVAYWSDCHPTAPLAILAALLVAISQMGASE